MVFKIILYILLILPSVKLQEFGDKFQIKIPKVFQVSVQSTLKTSKVGGITTLSTEYYDGENERGSVVSLTADGKSQIIFRKIKNNTSDGNNVEVFTIYNDVFCADFYTKNEDISFIGGTEMMINGYYFKYVLPNMTLISSNETIMGIKCNTYSATGLDFGPLANVTFFMYWSVDGKWRFPNCPIAQSTCNNTWAVPVASRMITDPDAKGVVSEIFNAYYEYKTSIDDPEIFQLPRGVMCEGMTPTNDFPKLSDHFSTGIEVYLLASNGVSEKQRLYYNIVDKLVRVDVDDFLGGYVLHMREIWDYEQDVVYKIDTDTGYCDVQNLTYSRQHVSNNHPMGILDYFLDESLDISKFFYVGKRTIRDTECDVWVSRSDEGDHIFEIYLTKEYVKSETDGTISEEFVPLLINMSSVLQGFEKNTELKSFFNYNIKIQPWDTFDVSPCFVDMHRYRFQIELKGPYYDIIPEYKSSFIHQIQNEIAAKVGIRPIRIQEIMIDHMRSNSTIILLSITLLEDPYIAGHLGIEEAYSISNQHVYAKLAEIILDEQNGPFFTFETPRQNYQYTATEIRELTLVSLQGGADLIESMFFKLDPFEIDSGYDYRTRNGARMDCFELCVNSLGFVCESFSYCKNDGQCSLSTYHIDEPLPEQIVLDARADCELYSRSYVKDYTISKNTETVGYDEENVSSQGVNEDDCARQCSLNTNNKPFYCEGFDFCQKPKSEKATCKFRAYHIREMNASEIRPSTQCSHYSRNYLDDFLKFKDSAVALKNYIVVVSDQTAADCARFCTSSADLNACRAFEMCSKEGDKERTQCRLLDASNMTESEVLYTSPDCDHYKRDRYLPPRHVPNQRQKTLQPATSPSREKLSTVSSSNSKLTGAGEKTISPNSEELGSSSTGTTSKSYSGGEMAGLAIGMLILGLIIGGGVLIGLKKYRIMN